MKGTGPRLSIIRTALDIENMNISTQIHIYDWLWGRVDFVDVISSNFAVLCTF